MVRLAFFLSLFILGTPLFSQSGWEDLNAKILNKKISVEEHGGNKHQGIARDVSAESIALASESGNNITVKREDVKKIKVRSRTRGMLWGLAIGAGIGALCGGLGYQYLENETGGGEAFVATSLGIFAGAGAGIGAASGAMQTVYQAPTTQSTGLRTPYSKPWPADRAQPARSREIPDYLAHAER
jgi:hypothetical protein